MKVTHENREDESYETIPASIPCVYMAQHNKNKEDTIFKIFRPNSSNWYTSLKFASHFKKNLTNV